MSLHSSSPATSRPPSRTLPASARRDDGGLLPAAAVRVEAASMISHIVRLCGTMGPADALPEAGRYQLASHAGRGHGCWLRRLPVTAADGCQALPS